MTNTCPSCQKVYGINAMECQTCLDYFNSIRLLVLPARSSNSSMNREEEQSLSGGAAERIARVHEMNLQELFIFTKKLEACAGTANLLYTQQKIAAAVPDPEKLERSAEEWKQALAEQKKANRSASEKRKDKQIESAEDKAIRAFEKLVSSYTNIGIARAAALEMASQLYQSQGKTVPTDLMA